MPAAALIPISAPVAVAVAETVPGAEPVAVASVPAAAPVSSPERESALSDLYWLLHQGHVIEFANGKMELAKKPQPRPEGGKAEVKSGDRPPKPERTERPPKERDGAPRRRGMVLVAAPSVVPFGPVAQLLGGV